MALYDTLPILKHLDVIYIWCFRFLYLFHPSTYIDVANEVFHVVASCIDSHALSKIIRLMVVGLFCLFRVGKDFFLKYSMLAVSIDIFISFPCF